MHAHLVLQGQVAWLENDCNLTTTSRKMLDLGGNIPVGSSVRLQPFLCWGYKRLDTTGHDVYTSQDWSWVMKCCQNWGTSALHWLFIVVRYGKCSYYSMYYIVHAMGSPACLSRGQKAGPDCTLQHYAHWDAALVMAVTTPHMLWLLLKSQENSKQLWNGWQSLHLHNGGYLIKTKQTHMHIVILQR